MKRIVIAVLMILVYWAAVFVVRKGYFFDDFVEGPFYLCLGEGLVRLGFYIGIAINALISLYLCARTHEDYAEMYGDDYYEYHYGPGVGSFVITFVLLWIVEVGVLFVLDKIFHLSDLVTSSTYLEHKMAWNIGLALVFHLICILLIIGGIIGRIHEYKEYYGYKQTKVENDINSTNERKEYKKDDSNERKKDENGMDSLSGMKEHFDRMVDISSQHRDVR